MSWLSGSWTILWPHFLLAAVQIFLLVAILWQAYVTRKMVNQGLVDLREYLKKND